MTDRKLAEVGIKLLGLMWLVSGMSSALPTAVAHYQGSEFAPAISLAFAGMTTLAGFLLLALASSIAERLFPQLTTLHLALTASDLLTVAFSTLGVYFLVGACVHGAGVVFELLAKPKWDQIPNTEYLWEKQMEAVVRFSVQFVAGIVLVIGRIRLAELLTKLRGDRSAPDNTNAHLPPRSN